jgi:hypothetical protein
VRLATLSDDPYTRANAGELLDALMRHRDQESLRALLRLVTEELPPEERAARAAPLVGRPTSIARGEALAALARDRDPILSRLAAACARETAPSVEARSAVRETHA